MMNKEAVISSLQAKTKLSLEECKSIDRIMEKNFFLSKRNKKKIIVELKENLRIEEEKAEEIYEIFREIISSAVVEKMKHPFGSNH